MSRKAIIRVIGLFVVFTVALFSQLALPVPTQVDRVRAPVLAQGPAVPVDRAGADR